MTAHIRGVVNVDLVLVPRCTGKVGDLTLQSQPL